MHIFYNLSGGLSCSLVAVIAGVLLANGAFGMNTDAAWQASWIWKHQDSYTGYNDTIEARKEVELPRVAAASMRITADTRYRLFINEQWVCDGPSRSWPHHYQYDVVDVGGFLRPGVNTVRIVAKYFGIGTFHQIPQEAGLLAQLEFTGKDGESLVIGTDDSWEVRVPAWLATPRSNPYRWVPLKFMMRECPKGPLKRPGYGMPLKPAPGKRWNPAIAPCLREFPFHSRL